MSQKECPTHRPQIVNVVIQKALMSVILNLHWNNPLQEQREQTGHSGGRRGWDEWREQH